LAGAFFEVEFHVEDVKVSCDFCLGQRLKHVHTPLFYALALMGKNMDSGYTELFGG
jgi:hypothetical protein